MKIPEGCRDVGLFIISDGEIAAKPTPPQHITLGELWRQYQEAMPEGAKDKSTMRVEKIHFGHLLRLLKATTALPLLTAADLQKYIKSRSQESGIRGQSLCSRTVKKELDTLRAMWNGFAVPHKLVATDFRT